MFQTTFIYIICQ